MLRRSDGANEDSQVLLTGAQRSRVTLAVHGDAPAVFELLEGLETDEQGCPVHAGQRAGIDACFRLVPA